MKKRKITYDLTARQKKELKRSSGANGAVTPKEPTAEEIALKESRVSARKLILVITATVLAVVFVLSGALIPVVQSNKEYSKLTNDYFLDWKTEEGETLTNPTATIHLVDGDGKNFGDIKLELFMDAAPNACINFIYLAESGFFDNTIFHDKTQGLIWFGGYKLNAEYDSDDENSAKYVSKANDEKFLSKLTGFTKHNGNVVDGDDVDSANRKYKLGYRLTAETTKKNSGNQYGMLMMQAGTGSEYSTSTHFMFSTDTSPSFTKWNNGSNMGSYVSYVAKIANDDEGKSFDTLDKINALATAGKENGKENNAKQIYYQYIDVSLVKIASIETSLSKAQRKYILKNFESFVTSGTWRANAYNPEYFKFN